MSLVSGFANQTASLEKWTGKKDGFNKPILAPARTIKVRREPVKGVTRSATGTDVAVETYYLTEATVAVEDRLDGSAVRRVQEMIDENGQRIGCEVWI